MDVVWIRFSGHYMYGYDIIQHSRIMHLNTG